MGDARDFFPADRWNPDGYFERQDLIDVNRALVRGSLGPLAYLRLPGPSTVLRRARRFGTTLRELGDLCDGWVVKEPRFCLTLSAWLAHGVTVSRLLVCLREPQAVAESLWRRNRLPRWRGLSLWEEHCRRLLDSARDAAIPIRFLAYRQVLDSDRFMGEVAGAFEFMGFSDRAGPERLDALRRLCVRSGTSRRPAEGIRYPRAVRELWGELMERHAAQEIGDVS